MFTDAFEKTAMPEISPEAAKKLFFDLTKALKRTPKFSDKAHKVINKDYRNLAKAKLIGQIVTPTVGGATIGAISGEKGEKKKGALHGAALGFVGGATGSAAAMLPISKYTTKGIYKAQLGMIKKYGPAAISAKTAKGKQIDYRDIVKANEHFQKVKSGPLKRRYLAGAAGGAAAEYGIRKAFGDKKKKPVEKTAAKKKPKVQYMIPLSSAKAEHYMSGKLYDHSKNKFIKNLMGVK